VGQLGYKDINPNIPNNVNQKLLLVAVNIAYHIVVKLVLEYEIVKLNMYNEIS